MGKESVETIKAESRGLRGTLEAELANGELVCIFPEGAITRKGSLGVFKPGVMKILKTSPVPVVPMVLGSAAVMVLFSLLTPAPGRATIEKYFPARAADASGRRVNTMGSPATASLS